MIGQREKILLEQISRRNSNEWVGKTGNFKKVIVTAEPGFKEGMYVECMIKEIRGHTLAGAIQRGCPC
jgi:tRNA-2-methylthio-N6-dimethylallyladenosine synthase